ncbi:DUF6544 family protein [Pontibacter cellulosilyticus]|uniref:Uncharacterized protein n=1 Tax=Pontibacter cellulosilyticus TaxID=1720253 RepID=A0A923SID6_9BACT|nr:DUF6544 family protein [Pontibacter cellulosilyticus]MBC5991556.1 hypothetical protein [Pontibacter cellulosilyticus]
MSLKKLFLQEVKQELVKQQHTAPILRPEDISKLPPLIQTYLEKAGFIDKPLAENFYITWEGTSLKLNPQKEWMPIACVQFNAAQSPMRNALMTSKMFGFIPFSGKDKYQDGSGNMFIKLLAFTVSDARGPEMDISALVTFLSEAILLPAALMSPYIRLQQVDDKTVTATITDRGKTATGKFYFNSDGLPERFKTEDRFFSTDGAEYDRLPWVAYYLNYKKISDYVLPGELRASWLLPEGEYEYFTGKIKNITYNVQNIAQLNQ